MKRMRRISYVLFCLAFSVVGCISVLADDWEIDGFYLENDIETVDFQTNEIENMLEDDFEIDYVDFNEQEETEFFSGMASPSDAQFFDFETPPVDDSGNRSSRSKRSTNWTTQFQYTTFPASNYVEYARGIVEKLSHKYHYVFWKSSQYTYRLVYAENMTIARNTFTATNAKYIEWSNNSTVQYGNEGNFRLSAGQQMVYTDLESPYPALERGVKNNEFKTLLFMFATLLLFNIVHAFFNVGKFVF